MTPLLIAQSLRTQRVEQHVEFARWSSGNPLLVGVIATVVILYAVFWLYQREARGTVSRSLRWSMIVCRAIVLILLGVIGLEPVLVNYVHRRQEACTLVLADSSASMSLIDAYRNPDDAKRVEQFLGPRQTDAPAPSRSQLVDRLLSADGATFIERLAAKNATRLFAFSESASMIGQFANPDTTTAPDAPPLIVLEPVGPATNLAASVRGAIDTVGGAPIAGVVILTDGGFNQGEPVAAIASMLRQKGIPSYVVGVGDPADPINAAITEITAPRAVFKNDPFSVSVRIDSKNTGDGPITVELLEKVGDAANPQVVDTKTIHPDVDGRLAPAVFERKLAKPGKAAYTARIPKLPGESVASDNERELLPSVQILDDKMRVLLVAGAPSYDYRYLARMLERDKSVDVSCWLQSADEKAVRDGTTVITELPTKQEVLFKYDAVILMDVDPSELSPTLSGLLVSFVADHGGGLLYSAGNKYTGKFLRSPNTTALVELLPVVPDPDAEITMNDLGHYQTRSWPLQIPDAVIGDPLLRMSDVPADNRAVWSALDGAYWHYPVRREKPVAQVLLRHSDPRMVSAFGSHVLLATQFVGVGRSAFLGLNSTWRWRRTDDVYFNRFWTQLLRYLVEGKLLGGKTRCLIQTAKDQYELGESVVVTVRALDEQFNPMLLPQVSADVAPPDGADSTKRTITLTPTPAREGYYEGRFTAERTGATRLTVRLPGSGPETLGTRDIAVMQPDLEMRNTAMNRDVLRQFAQAVAGAYFDIDEASRLPELIPDRSRTYVTRERPRPLWDNYYVLSVLVAFLTLEWILRKKGKLL
ncbi:MAG: VWA domain-containing protein [Planctomycetes bacterium]|nr:VWA domain-containing protein [Planctomycetota bacterium]